LGLRVAMHIGFRVYRPSWVVYALSALVLC
jgi:hypothetical protein